MNSLQTALETTIHDLFDIKLTPELTRPDEQFGDYATNVALQLASKVGKSPREIADKVATALKQKLGDSVKEVSIAGPGFINITLGDKELLAQAAKAGWEKPDTYKGQQVVAEYSDPNPFKVLHAGHLYTSVVGDGIANLLQAAGAEVHRVNFGGDVGLHVGKCMWAILRELDGEHPEKLQHVPEGERAEWMAARYVEGTAAYELDDTSKQEIIDLNKRVYQLHEGNDKQSPFAHIYWTCRQWSYDYFDAFYARIGSKFDKYYPESETTPLGIRVVNEQLAKGVYEHSDGAIVFKGEPYGLHTRVFINSQGLPTYEGKDVGLIMAKWHDYHFDKSIVITGNDIVDYMKVVLKSIEQYEPTLAKRSVHLVHGMVKLQGGAKMSSRKGNFLRAVDVLDVAAETNRKLTGQDNEQTVMAAVKYSFLKQRMGGDIIYDPQESVSLEGNSGPYLQYAHARARSILAKVAADATPVDHLEADERSLVRKLGEYSEVVQRAVDELAPHIICTYLYELSQTFNRFYEHNRVIDDPRQAERLYMVERYADVLKDGLSLLNIPAPGRL